mmetsp:Transcript_45963/g.116309  ORF Transcript_45963/g.116309 Transcript_45963/m.116309 type:complete len:278 (+) Transcript_45963:240-1073(+)
MPLVLQHGLRPVWPDLPSFYCACLLAVGQEWLPELTRTTSPTHTHVARPVSRLPITCRPLTPVATLRINHRLVLGGKQRTLGLCASPHLPLRGGQRTSSSGCAGGSAAPLVATGTLGSPPDFFRFILRTTRSALSSSLSPLRAGAGFSSPAGDPAGGCCGGEGGGGSSMDAAPAAAPRRRFGMLRASCIAIAISLRVRSVPCFVSAAAAPSSGTSTTSSLRSMVISFNCRLLHATFFCRISPEGLMTTSSSRSALLVSSMYPTSSSRESCTRSISAQ